LSNLGPHFEQWFLQRVKKFEAMAAELEFLEPGDYKDNLALQACNSWGD